MVNTSLRVLIERKVLLGLLTFRLEMCLVIAPRSELLQSNTGKRQPLLGNLSNAKMIF